MKTETIIARTMLLILLASTALGESTWIKKVPYSFWEAAGLAQRKEAGNKKELYALLDQYADITEDGIVIDLYPASEEWNRCIKRIDPADDSPKVYPMMAEYLCEVYREKFGREFLFSDACVANEIMFHLTAYMNEMDYEGYHTQEILDVYAFLHSRGDMIWHCQLIEILTKDVSNYEQSIVFHYRSGIRDCYKGTEMDPYRKTRR